MKKTAVLGASPNPQRYSYKAVQMLTNHGHKALALGIRNGQINGVEIITKWEQYTDVHTITLYMNPKRQEQYYEYILHLKPKRIIFNPGTENEELVQKAIKNGIEVVENCTLVMLSQGIY